MAFLLLPMVLAVPDSPRPNILFFFSDDHATHAMSCYTRDGAANADRPTIIQTPHLDRIADGGMRFDNCFCTNSLCGPSRAVIQTGKHNHLNGFMRNGDTFNGDQQTFPKLLRAAGYQTAIVGKWHLKSEPQGFDRFDVLVGQGTYYNSAMKVGGEGLETRVERPTSYVTTEIGDRTVKWLRGEGDRARDPSKPFLLMCQHKCPHREWQPGPGYFDRFKEDLPEPATLFDDYSGRGRAAHEQDMSIEKTLTARDLKLEPPPYLNADQLEMWNSQFGWRKELMDSKQFTPESLVRTKYQWYMKDYLRTIAAMDDQIGRVLDELETLGLAENTVVIYSSDQGFYLGDHGWFDKRFMYEESYRQPLIAKWPGHIEPGSVSKALVSNLDFAQTFLDLAGVEQPGDMQGRSLKPILENGATPEDWRDSLYYHYYEFLQDRRTAHMVRRHNGVRTARYKLMHFYNVGEWELFDLENDPLELKSVYGAPEYADVQAELTAELDRLMEQYDVPDDRGSVDADPPSLKLPAVKVRKKRRKQAA